MTNAELKIYLDQHPNMMICPNCGGAGSRIFPRNGVSVECYTCEGVGVIERQKSGEYRVPRE